LWDHLERPWQTCISNAWELICRLPEDRFSFIGAAVTDRDGNVLSVGTGHDLSDGTIRIAGADGKPLTDHVLAHAELAALLRLDYGSGPVKERACSLYTTLEPCPLCIGAAVMSNAVAELRYAARDPWGGCIGMFDSTPYLRRQREHLLIVGPEDRPELEEVLTALRIAGWLSWDGREHIVAASSSMAPRAAKVAGELVQADRLAEWRRARADVSEVISTIHTMLSG
jgi:tRNA(adenine34) deaminase